MAPTTSSPINSSPQEGAHLEFSISQCLCCGLSLAWWEHGFAREQAEMLWRPAVVGGLQHSWVWKRGGQCMLSLVVGRRDQLAAQSVSNSYFLLLSFLCSFNLRFLHQSHELVRHWKGNSQLSRRCNAVFENSFPLCTGTMAWVKTN